MTTAQRFLYGVALSLGFLAAASGRLDAQPGKMNGGRKSGRTPAPVVNTPAPAPVQQHNYHYNSYPAVAYPIAASAYHAPAVPYAGFPSVTYVNQYFVVPPPYMPAWPVAAYFVPPPSGWGTGGGFPPIIPRYDTGPKEATIEVLMPRSDAILMVDGAKTGAEGLRRFFTSPPLEAGTYAYQVTTSWMREDQEIRMERTVEVSPGGRYLVDFNKIDPASTVSAAD